MRSGQLFILLMGLLVGFWGGKFWAQQSPNKVAAVACPQDAVTCVAPPAAMGELGKISPEQVREYLKIQNAEEKLKKADEILSKIVAALITDIGFKFGQEDLAQFGKTASITTTTEPHIPSTTLVGVKAIPDQGQQTAQARLQIRNATTEQQAMAVLSGLGANISNSLSSSGLLTREQIRELSGLFEGTLTYNDQQVVRTTLRFNGRLAGGKLQGNAEIQIFDANGKVTSNSSSSGDLSSNYTTADNSIFIEASKAYLQIVFFPRMDQWMGNYFENKKGSLVKTGTLMYQKRSGGL